jgi:hypothetical protein
VCTQWTFVCTHTWKKGGRKAGRDSERASERERERESVSMCVRERPNHSLWHARTRTHHTRAQTHICTALASLSLVQIYVCVLNISRNINIAYVRVHVRMRRRIACSHMKKNQFCKHARACMRTVANIFLDI